MAFLSNKPLETRADYAAKLTRLGVPAAAEDVINSSLVLARHLATLDPGGQFQWRQDGEFGVLELIMTAPVVVASWISLQYYGSSEMVRDLSDIREMAEEMRIHRNKTRPSFVARVRNKPDLAEDIR